MFRFIKRVRKDYDTLCYLTAQICQLLIFTLDSERICIVKKLECFVTGLLENGFLFVYPSDIRHSLTLSLITW